MVQGKQGDVDDALVRRREYFREKKRNSRLQKRQEVDRLKAQLIELQAQVSACRNRSRGSQSSALCIRQDDLALSWQSIATHLKRENRAVIAERDTLVKEVETYRSLVYDMLQWVTSTERIPISPRAVVRWHDVSLRGHGEARKQAKEWATQQMYYNTDAAFRAFPQAPEDDDPFVFSMDVSGTWVNFTEYSQCVWPAPLEVARYMLRHYMSEMSNGFGTVLVDTTEWTDNTVLYYFKPKPGNDEQIGACSLQGQFHEADRCVFVLRQIQGDELCDFPLRQAQGLLWIDLRRLDGGRTLARLANLGSMELTRSGAWSLDNMAKQVGVDTTHLDEEGKIQVLQRVLGERAFTHERNLRRQINLLLARLWDELLLTRTQHDAASS
ncbi:hypothetical protein AeMF1_009820 [Aphanomyces euteiches]|nr:hypothetical protein AeMF1_009820 [Aphanomyces euteiches]KAH9187769.1 hypothetical protein AeNC1_010258 [Aphanomyces euteiches]